MLRVEGCRVHVNVEKGILLLDAARTDRQGRTVEL
jgi:hypothetical protein